MKSSSIITHLAAAAIVSAIILLVYASVQQSHRTSANDPQLQIARDASNALSKGKAAYHYFSPDTIDLQASPSVFIELFDADGNPLQSTGLLNGRLPQPPKGVFNYANANHENTVTWQPQPDVRMAMVFEKINSTGGGFVAVGRSLKETELRESSLSKMVLITWVACIGILLTHFFAQLYFKKRSTQTV